MSKVRTIDEYFLEKLESAEAKAKEVIKNMLDEHNKILEKVNELEELKRVPTAKEVCEAIQEHLTLKKIVYNEKNNSFGWEYGDPLICLPLIELEEERVTHYLPFTTPKILILIGRFYEGQANKNVS